MLWYVLSVLVVLVVLGSVGVATAVTTEPRKPVKPHYYYHHRVRRWHVRQDYHQVAQYLHNSSHRHLF